MKIYYCDPNASHIEDIQLTKTNIIEQSDFIFLNFKIKSKQTGIKCINENTEPIISNALKLSKQYKKKLIYCCTGDRPPQINLFNYDIIVLKTSLSASTMLKTEMVIGVVLKDSFKHFIEHPKLTIGFCGQSGCGRKKWLDCLNSNQLLETNFILRDSYITHLKPSHITDYDSNMNDNLFTFCYRGGGNFSVRFYETLMRGRIPIVIKTDSVFPFENIINYDKIGIFVEECELTLENNLDSIILNFYNSKTADELLDIQKYNRSIYFDFFHKDTYWTKIFENALQN
jgi:hypothetical protein